MKTDESCSHLFNREKAGWPCFNCGALGRPLAAMSDPIDPIMQLVDEHFHAAMGLTYFGAAEARAAIEREVAALRERAERAEAGEERERMRLAACGVAALGYFDGCHDDYLSASLTDVLTLRQREKECRQRIADLEAERATPALPLYNEFVSADDNLNALERLRAFCAFAMKGQDWLDVEPFFAAVEAERAALMEAGKVLATEKPIEKYRDAWHVCYGTPGALAAWMAKEKQS